MNDELFYELTTKFLSRELTDQERDDLTILLQIENYKNKFETIVTKWNSDRWNGEKFDVNSGLERLKEILSEKDPSFYWGESIDKKRSLFFRPYFIKAAAAVLLFIGLSALIVFSSGIFFKQQHPVLWSEKKNQQGEKSKITLIDGSSVVLNAGSSLSYPNQFDKDKREVFLEGEAYFVVTSNRDKPFIVHSADISTTVLGTRFNVSSFQEDKSITISLEEGKVKVSKDNYDNKFEPVYLNPDEKLVYDKEKSSSIVKLCDIQQETGWKDNILKFKSVPLSNVIVKLERAYGVKFEFPDKSYDKQKITTNFQDASIWSISEVLKKLTGLQYKTIKADNSIKKIVFYKGNKK